MDKSSLESILYKLSIKAIHAMSGDTLDVFTIKEAIEHIACFRPIYRCVQIWELDFSNKENYCDISFVLSPDFMNDNHILTYSHLLNYLNWTLSIQNYDYGEDVAGNKVSEEDGVDGWLIKSDIKVDYEIANIKELDLEEFEKAILKTETN